jgi:hypothetical protein
MTKRSRDGVPVGFGAGYHLFNVNEWLMFVARSLYRDKSMEDVLESGFVDVRISIAGSS